MLSAKTKWFTAPILLLMLLFPPCTRKGVWVDFKGAGEVAAATNAQLDRQYFGSTPHYAWIGSRPLTTTREDQVTVPLQGVNWMLVADTSSVASPILAAQLLLVLLAAVVYDRAAKRPESPNEEEVEQGTAADETGAADVKSETAEPPR